jgi:glycosyltransferase involved in cell wall biosynthesis
MYVHHGPIATDGAFVSLYELIQALDRGKYEPLVVLKTSGSAAEKISALGIPLFFAYPLPIYHHIVFEDSLGIRLTNLFGLLKLLVSLIPAWSLVRIIKQQKPHVIHLNGIRYTSAALAAWLTGTPVVWHVREMPADGIFGLRKALLLFLVKTLSKAVILISEHHAVALPGIAQSLVIHNPIDAKRFDRDQVTCDSLKREFAHFSSWKRLLYVGYISQPKGIDYLVEAFALVVAEMPEVGLLLVGSSGSEAFEESLRDKIDKLDLQNKVVLTGHRDDVPALMKFADLVVFPSRLKAIGRSVIEAAAMAKPSVATVEIKSSDIIIDGITGRLVMPENPRELAEAVLMLLQDDDLTLKMGEAAYQHIGVPCFAENYAKRIEKVYQAVLDKNVKELAETASY